MLNKNIMLPALLVICISLVSGCAKLDKLRNKLNYNSGLSQSQIAAGLKEAMRVGSDTVVNKLGTRNGFNKDQHAHIHLPKDLIQAQEALKKIGYRHYLDDLELKLNRAAEKATPRAKTLFFNAITQLSWKDVKNIYHGQDDAATRYFQNKMSPTLKKDMYPVINNVLAEVGAIQSYERSMKKYQSIPFVPDVRADMTDYTITKTLDAIFYYLAKEETGIRKDPAKRTTKLLRQVFGNN